MPVTRPKAEPEEKILVPMSKAANKVVVALARQLDGIPDFILKPGAISFGEDYAYVRIGNRWCARGGRSYRWLDVYGCVGGYNMQAADASHHLEALGLVTKAENEAFHKWFWEEEKAGQHLAEERKMRELAKKLGFEVAKVTKEKAR